MTSRITYVVQRTPFHPGTWPTRTQTAARRLIAECTGTFGLVFFGAGAATIDTATSGSLGRVGIGLTFGLAVTAMVLVFGRISGAHINPAVTFALWRAGHFPGRRAVTYVVAQLIGCLLAASVLHGLFRNTGGDLGATLPAGELWQSFGLEIVLTFILIYAILAVAHQRQSSLEVVAIVAGIIVGLEATFAGGISGASMNPARSFGPAAIGWEWNSHWIYWVAPAIGAGLAVGLHVLLRPPAENAEDNEKAPRQTKAK